MAITISQQTMQHEIRALHEQKHYQKRSALLTRMAQSRKRVRYLVAPRSLGKTSLVWDYIDSCSIVNQTLVIRADDPYFFMALDEDTLSDFVLAKAASKRLIYFKDVALLTLIQKQRLWEACKACLSKGKEVVVSTSPFADPLRSWQNFCCVIEGSDWIRFETRCAPSSGRGTAETSDMAGVGPNAFEAGSTSSYAVFEINPTFIQSAQHSYDIIRHWLKEAPVDKRSYLFFSCLCAGLPKAMYEELTAAFYSGPKSTECECPFVVEDGALDVCMSLLVPAPYLQNCMNPYLDEWLRTFHMEHLSDLLERVITSAIRYACLDEVLQRIYPWLCSVPRDVTGKLLEAWNYAGQFSQSSALVHAYVVHGYPLTDYADLIWKTALLWAYPSRDSLELIERVACSSRVDACTRLRAICVIATLLRVHRRMLYIRAEELSALIPLWFQEICMNWSSRIGEGGEGILNVLRLCAKGVLPEEDFLSLSKSNQVDILYAMSLAALLHPSRQRHFESYVESLAAEHFEGVHFSHFLLAHLVESFDETLVTASLKNRKAFFQSRFTELSRDEEAIQVIYELKSAQDIRGAYVCRDDAQVLNTHHALSQSSGHTSHSFELASLSQKKDVVAIQPIYIHVMGEFGVNIGGVEVSHAEFVRSKARMLCAILALEPGKYISCGKLACEIWPDYEYEKARTYLSILISHIRRVFRLTDGSCPYLVRERNAIALAGDYVKSDAGEIFRICNSADVARMDSDELSQTMHALVKLYSADLLEGVDDIALISNLRVMLKKTYVDKLLAISKAQESMRQYERALSASVWALHCDQTREDCYARAMHMYAQCSQRAQAVQVWQEYCTFMREEIGLSPSEDVHELYMHIIQDETHAGDDE